MSEFAASIVASVPPVTLVLLSNIALTTLPCLLNIVSPFQVSNSWLRIRQSFEVWRPFTALFYGGSGFPLLFDFFLIYRNSTSLENDIRDTAAYAWMHVVLGIFLHTFNLILDAPFLFRPLLHAQTYIWCRYNPSLRVSIFGLMTIPTALYPVVLIILDLLTGGPPKAFGGIMGLGAGHLWWFLSIYIPLYAPRHLRRQSPTTVPRFFRAFFHSQGPIVRSTGGVVGGAIGPVTAHKSNNDNIINHRWGSGQRLGGDSL